MRHVTAAAAALFAVLALMAGAAHADGSTNTNTHSASGVGDVDQTGNININFQGSNDDNTINNSVTTNAASANVSASASATADGGSTSVSVDGDEFDAASAAPVYLTTSNDTCMGSSGVGGQGATFGFSIGSTWTDSNCIMLKNARELKAQGYPKAAKARLCMDEDNAMAFELSGDPCPRGLKSTQNVVAKLTAKTANHAASSLPVIQLASLVPVAATWRHRQPSVFGGSVAPSQAGATRTEEQKGAKTWRQSARRSAERGASVLELAMASVEDAIE